MGRHGSKSSDNRGKLTAIAILNFGIFKISGPFGAPGPGPGPGLAQGPDFGPKFWSKYVILQKWVPDWPKWVDIGWDPLITY